MTIIIINLVTLILVQLKIEVFKKTANLPKSAAAADTYFEINVGYSKNTLRTIVFIICIVFFTVLFWSFNIGSDSTNLSPEESNLFISRLILVSLTQFTLFNLIPIIFIVRNVKLFKFVKKQIKTCLHLQNLKRHLVVLPFYAVYVVPQSSIAKRHSTCTDFEML